MQFEEIIYLWLLLPALAVLGGFFVWAWRTKRRLIGQFVSARLLPTLLLNVAVERQKTRMWLVLAAVGLLLLALARPQFGFSYEEVRSRGLDIVVALDTSRSMLATDVAPNRLRRAQLAALDLKRIARSDRVGLVAFAGGAFLQCPLTLDDEAFRQSVEALDVAIIPQGGTAVAEAIQTARSAFKEGNDNHKVLVLFTDGEDHDGQAVETAKTAARDGMRIFAVGVGTPNGDVLRTTDASGRSEFIKGPDGNAVRSQLNESLLRELSAETGGFYLPLSGAGTIDMLYERGLAPLPRSEQAAQRVRRHHERYQWLLAAALVLLLAEMFVPERKESKRAAAAGAPDGAVKASTGVTTTIIGTLLLLSMTGVKAGPDKAYREFVSGNFEASWIEYELAVEKKPGNPLLHYNAGTAAYEGQNYHRAAEHLNAALTNAGVNLQQRIYYNLGNTLYRIGQATEAFGEKQRQWEQALKCFQNAAALNPADADATFNTGFIQFKLAELRELQRLLEEARKAKLRAGDAVKRRDYEAALRIMTPTLTNSLTAKEMQEYAQRLKDACEIINPPSR